MAKKSNKKTLKDNSKSILRKILGIFSGSFILIFSVCLILSMIGYTPTDESFNVSNSDKINNFMGRFGSYSSDFIATLPG